MRRANGTSDSAKRETNLATILFGALSQICERRLLIAGPSFFPHATTRLRIERFSLFYIGDLLISAEKIQVRLKSGKNMRLFISRRAHLHEVSLIKGVV